MLKINKVFDLSIKSLEKNVCDSVFVCPLLSTRAVLCVGSAIVCAIMYHVA